jgi:hypothetical protein
MAGLPDQTVLEHCRCQKPDRTNLRGKEYRMLELLSLRKGTAQGNVP